MNLISPLFELHYAEWMIIAGGVLVLIGFFGLAFSQNRNLQPDELNVGAKPKP